MEEEGLTKTELGKRMNVSRAQLDRLLDPDNESVTLATLNHQNGKPESAGEHADKSSTNSPISAVPEFFQRQRGRSHHRVLRRARRLRRLRLLLHRRF